MQYKNDDESLDYFMGGKLAVLQKKKGYRFSLDSILLASFSYLGFRDHAVELGAGSGIISMILALRDKPENITGIDIQESQVQMAERSAHLNGLESRVRFLCADIRKIRSYLEPESFTAVVCNPPYRKIRTGKINPDRQKAEARHELNGGVSDFMEATRYLLKEKGHLFVIFPAQRSVTLLSSMRKCCIEPKRIRFVYSDKKSPAEFILAEGRKGGGEEAKIDQPLVVYDERGSYSEELKDIFAGLTFFRNGDGV
ncbi:MAG: methyltransferase [Syntrophales bacterium]|nr:methyltransferase [Syntrophales bacterium]MDY0044266.1 methyltransferase [Syntrophales bacterium]